LFGLPFTLPDFTELLSVMLKAPEDDPILIPIDFPTALPDLLIKSVFPPRSALAGVPPIESDFSDYFKDGVALAPV
jgi:hypothetical protein